MSLGRRWGHEGCSRFMTFAMQIQALSLLAICFIALQRDGSRLAIIVLAATAMICSQISTLPYAAYVRDREGKAAGGA